MRRIEVRRALFIANSSWYLLNFRANTMRRLLERGWEVYAVAPPDRHAEALAAVGFQVLPWHLHGRGYSIGREMAALFALLRIYRRLRPELVHTFTIKPTLHAQLASRICRASVPVSSITGLGHAFLGGGMTRFVAESLYRLCLRPDSSVIFQNQADLDYFTSKRLLRGASAHLIPGSGVDVERFQPRLGASVAPGAPTRVLFVGRLLREKGVHELLAAAIILHERHVHAEVLIAGSALLGNPSSLSPAERQDHGIVKWLGEVVPVDDLLASADMLVLPSWREGLPRTVLEAMAMGKAVVATDVPGCRDAVVHGETGLLVPLGNPQALAMAIETLVKDVPRREALGRAGRARAVALYSQELIEAQTLAVYGRHLGAEP